MLTLHGMPIFESEFATKKEHKPTRRQTRKFKNNRWVKKYRKRHTVVIRAPSIYVVGNQRLVVHPALMGEVRNAIESNCRKEPLSDPYLARTDNRYFFGIHDY